LRIIEYAIDGDNDGCGTRSRQGEAASEVALGHAANDIRRMNTYRTLGCAALIAIGSPAVADAQGAYLFVWAGGAGGNEALVTIDATPTSPTYGRVLASAPTGVVGSPHHTESQLGSTGHLLANDFHAGRTWLFDLNDPLHPRVITSFGDVAGFSHPHSFIRLANGHVLSTFEYRPEAPPTANAHDHMQMSGEHVTGGLVEMDEMGHPFASGDAADTTIRDRRIYPYSVLPIPSMDRAVSTTTDMDHADTIATSQWVQLWRLSDLKLERSIELPPGPRGNENQLTGEPRLLPDGHSVYIHTFHCGLYLLRDIGRDRPKATFVTSFEGVNCGVPVLTGHYWLQTVPAAHALVALDISDAEHPKEVSRVTLPADESPHWIAIDATGRRVVLNSGGKGSRLCVIDFDPANGRLALDQRFRDPGSTSAGISLSGANWAGFTGVVSPHGAVFSR
jgi:hypothetical protein